MSRLRRQMSYSASLSSMTATSICSSRVWVDSTMLYGCDGSGDLRGGPHAEAKLGLLAVVDGQALAQQSTQARASATTDSLEDHEALQTSAVVGQLADTVEHQVNNLLANGVVTTGEVVGGVL